MHFTEAPAVESTSAEQSSNPSDEQLDAGIIAVDLPPSEISSVARKLLKMGVPMSVAGTIYTVNNFGTVLLLAHLGKETLSASSLIGAGEIILTFFSGAMRSTAIVAGKYQMQASDEVGAVFRNALLMGAGLSVPLVVLCYFSKPISQFFGYPAPLAQISEDFFRYYAIGVPGSFGLIANEQIAASVDQPELMVLANIVQTSVSIGSGYCFSKVRHMGARGVALGIIAGNYAAFLTSTIYLALHPAFKAYNLYRWGLGKDFKEIQKSLWKLGIPMSLTVGIVLVSQVGITFLSGRFKADSLAALSVSTQYLGLTLMPISGFYPALSIYTSKLVSAKAYGVVNRYTGMNLLITSLYSALVLLFTLTIPQKLITPFVHHSSENIEQKDYTAVIDIGAKLLRLAGLAVLVMPWLFTFMSVLYAFNDTQAGILVNVFLELIAALGVGYLIATSGSLGVMGFSVARLVGLVIGSGMMAYRYHAVCQSYKAEGKAKEVSDHLKDGWNNTVGKCFRRLRTYFLKEEEKPSQLLTPLLTNDPETLFDEDIARCSPPLPGKESDTFNSHARGASFSPKEMHSSSVSDDDGFCGSKLSIL